MTRYPENILQPRVGGDPHIFGFQPSVAKLLSLTSGIEESHILNVKIYCRSWRRYLPWYAARKGGGAITLGNSTGQRIYFTENFFSDDKQQFGPNAKAHRTMDWLRLSAHEVIHIAHTLRFGSLIFYLWVFLMQYLRYGHDCAPLEIEAEQGKIRFDRFNEFVNAYQAKNYLVDLLESHLSEDRKKEKIIELWEAYQNTNYG